MAEERNPPVEMASCFFNDEVLAGYEVTGLVFPSSHESEASIRKHSHALVVSRRVLRFFDLVF